MVSTTQTATFTSVDCGSTTPLSREDIVTHTIHENAELKQFLDANHMDCSVHTVVMGKNDVTGSASPSNDVIQHAIMKATTLVNPHPHRRSHTVIVLTSNPPDCAQSSPTLTPTPTTPVLNDASTTQSPITITSTRSISHRNSPFDPSNPTPNSSPPIRLSSRLVKHSSADSSLHFLDHPPSSSSSSSSSVVSIHSRSRPNDSFLNSTISPQPLSRRVASVDCSPEVTKPRSLGLFANTPVQDSRSLPLAQKVLKRNLLESPSTSPLFMSQSLQSRHLPTGSSNNGEGRITSPSIIARSIKRSHTDGGHHVLNGASSHGSSSLPHVSCINERIRSSSDEFRVTEIWELYAGRNAQLLHKRELVQLCEDLFDEIQSRYRRRLRLETKLTEYPDSQVEADLQADLPLILPASTNEPSKIPIRRDYIRYLFQRLMSSMIHSVPSNPSSMVIDRSGPNAPKLTKHEFMTGWKKSHEAIFAAIQQFKRNANRSMEIKPSM